MLCPNKLPSPPRTKQCGIDIHQEHQVAVTKDIRMKLKLNDEHNNTTNITNKNNDNDNNEKNEHQ